MEYDRMYKCIHGSPRRATFLSPGTANSNLVLGTLCLHIHIHFVHSNLSWTITTFNANTCKQCQCHAPNSTGLGQLLFSRTLC